ncbi:MAG: type IV pilus twitching motility protein PilT [Tissierellia bacterium]|nr:type IV pilus twitching motility protein PilT [Tissierellia bacterium]
MDLLRLIEHATVSTASDIHITVGMPPILRKDGKLIEFGDRILTPMDTKRLVEQVLDSEQLHRLSNRGEVDTSFSSPGVGRFRINAYNQRGSYALAIRIIPLRIPSMEELGIPPIVKELSRLPRGLILVTGPTGSGKTTTLASMVKLINEERKCHILTLEDPIEYLHKHDRSMVNQREIGMDTNSFSNALKAALRQDPDVILVGEMRDLETISTALTAAETGHLILSTLHTVGAAKTIDRVIDVFPPHQQQQVRIQLSSVIQAIISQQLLPRIDGYGRVAAFEVMVANPAIRNLIREEKIHQIDSSIQTGGQLGMQTMDKSLLELYNRRIISKKTLLNQAVDLDTVKRYIL